MASHLKGENDDPPPYSERPTDGHTTQVAASSSAAQVLPPPFSPQPLIPRQFPPAFNLYMTTRRHYFIGEHQTHPLYAVVLSPRYSPQPDVVLHGGPGEHTRALAVVDRDLMVALPPLAGAGGRRVEERFEAHGLGDNTVVFTIETGPGGRREAFEWRRSRGEEVRVLGGRERGWKLVRLRTDAPTGLGGQGRAVFGGGATAGDGREVVAVWAWATMSLTKKLRFRFLGSGASGVLGERWAVMAVVTALWSFERERRFNED
ncbi:hypothetical protein F5Y11DRAFT_362880 [Daldinia sp. FL1419]|nr:hypothetical protein F5Y11DRAFT_362880 [Daldinia sp. FL1419]